MKNKFSIIQHLEMYRLHQLTCESSQKNNLSKSLIMAWIYHDNLLEGRSFEPEDIQIAINQEDHLLPSYLQPLLEDIRLYQSAIQLVQTYSNKGKQYMSINKLQKLHKLLMTYEPKEGARVRTNSPVHRDYHHEISTHTQVPSLLRSFYREVHSFDVDHHEVISYVASLHCQLMHIYPYRRIPGLLARLFTNQFMLSHNYPPIILFSHERGEYYDALAEDNSEALSTLFYKAAGRYLQNNPNQYQSFFSRSLAS